MPSGVSFLNLFYFISCSYLASLTVCDLTCRTISEFKVPEFSLPLATQHPIHIASLLSVSSCTENEGPGRIQYKCLVPIYVFPVMNLLVPKQIYNVLSPSSYTHISVIYLYISRIGLPILLQGNMWTDPGKI